MQARDGDVPFFFRPLAVNPKEAVDLRQLLGAQLAEAARALVAQHAQAVRLVADKAEDLQRLQAAVWMLQSENVNLRAKLMRSQETSGDTDRLAATDEVVSSRAMPPSSPPPGLRGALGAFMSPPVPDSAPPELSVGSAPEPQEPQEVSEPEAPEAPAPEAEAEGPLPGVPGGDENIESECAPTPVHNGRWPTRKTWRRAVSPSISGPGARSSTLSVRSVRSSMGETVVGSRSSAYETVAKPCWDHSPTGASLPMQRHGGKGMCTDKEPAAKMVFSLLPIWRKEHSALPRSNTQALDLISDVGDDVQLPTAATDQQDKASCCVIHPFSLKRVGWDLLNIVLVIYDIGAIPLDFFNPADSWLTDTMEWTTRAFWTTDILVSFTKGAVMSDGYIQLSFPKIARSYATTWFLFDLAVVGSDWAEVFWDSNIGSYAVLGRATRAFRIVRMARLLRLLRMREVLSFLFEQISSYRVLIALDGLKIVIFILGLSHIIACLWYGIGSRDVDDGTWTRVYHFTESDAPLIDRYGMSLHWTLSQFTGGMGEVTAQNIWERLFNIAVWWVAFIVAGVFVSSLTSSMTQLNIIGSQHSQQLAVLRQYLSIHGIPQRLMLRVQRNAQHAMRERERYMPEEGVELLQTVSEPLRIEIHFEMFAPALRMHPFFSSYISACPQVLSRVCHNAMSISLVSGGDVIFYSSEIPSPPRMYIVLSGSLRYVTPSGDRVTVNEGEWVSEATLWTTWVHRGVLTAFRDCRLCILDAAKFQSIVTLFEHGNFDPRAYGGQFIQALNQCDDITDLALGVESFLLGSRSGQLFQTADRRRTTEVYG